MRYQWQREITRELNALIPRGRRGSLQNMLRQAFWFHRMQRRFSREESLAMALGEVKKHYPTFMPRIMPTGITS
jgi:hypothetical protein